MDKSSTLSPAKQALLQQRLKWASDAPPRGPDIPRRPRREFAPLSFAQRQMWVVDQMTPGNAAYGLPIGYRLRGTLNVTALERSFNEILKRHEGLRTTFAATDGEPLQLIHPYLAIKITVTELAHLPNETREGRLQTLASEQSIKSFDLSRLPLIRVSLFKLGDAEHVLLINLHHIVADGMSIGPMLAELDTFYRAFTGGGDPHPPELAVQYADFAQWQRQTMADEAAHASQIEFWRRQLGGKLPVLELPPDRLRPLLQSFKGSNVFANISKTLAQELRLLGSREGCTLFMTVLAAFQVLLHRYSGANDIVIGTPVAARTARQLEPLIGNFLNMTALRCDLSGNPTFVGLLRRTRDTTLDAFSNGDLPFEAMMKHLRVERDPGRNPIFQALLQVSPTTSPRIGDLEVSSFHFDLGFAQFDVSLHLYEEDGGYSTRFEYCTDLFEAQTVERLSSNFLQLLHAVVRNPDESIASLPLMTDFERQQLLVEWNSTAATSPRRGVCLHQLIEEQAARSPHRTAVVFERQMLTYDELNRRANQLAHHLRNRGVEPDGLVGLFVERSLEMLVGILGILKAGGAYVPIDPGYPKERLQCILEDSNASIVLTQESLIHDLPGFAGHSIRLDADWAEIARESETNPVTHVKPEHLAYVLFTSGSTGRPKGVALEHRSAVTFIQWAQQVFTPQELAAVVFSTSICFDLSVFEIFVTLSGGGKIVLALNALHLPTVPERNEVTLINTVPSAIAELLRLGAVPASVKTVNLAGEALSEVLVEQIYATTNVDTIYNLYGPTEATTYSTYTLVHRGCPVTIGRPIADTQAYILDSGRNPVPIGVVGELYLAGGGLARGYYGRPELTNERFVPNPLSKEPSRMYRTGDLCRWLPDGNIQYLGRTDHQVKLRGFRIELGEIEATLNRHPAVRQSVVIVREDEPGRKQLVAYVVLESGVVAPTREFRQHVKERLPDFMVPSAVVLLDAFPLTPNGKINRPALPEPDLSDALDTGFVAPQTPNERILADIWSHVLRVERVGVHDKFFELGGDSILSIQVVARANQAGLRLTMKQMFQYQTIAELALVAEDTAKHLPDKGPVTGDVPLTPIQRWFFEQDFADPHHWNQAVFLELRRNVEPSVLEQGIRHLLIHHDALRLRFCRRGEDWSQFNTAPDGAVSMSRIDLGELSEAEQNSAMHQASAELQGQLDLADGPLLRTASFDLGPQRRSRLLIVIHHLAVDGVSWRILLEDLQTLCEQLGRGSTIELPPRTSSFKHWAQRLTEHARTTTFQQEADYWLAALPAEPAALPVDFAHGSNSEASTCIVSVALDAEHTRTLLLRVPQAYNTHINDVLLSALGLTLSRWIGRATVAIDLEGHGREDLFEDIDLSRTVGWFTSIFPVRLDLRRMADAGDVLKSVKEQLRRVPQHGIGYGLLKYLARTAKAAQLLTMPASQVLFNYLGQFDLPAASPFAWLSEPAGRLHSPRAHRSHLLEINGRVADDQLRLEWTYSQNVHLRGTIERLAEGFLEELRTLIRHCTSPDARGYTPSDFADAGLNQAELDRLIAELG